MPFSKIMGHLDFSYSISFKIRGKMFFFLILDPYRNLFPNSAGQTNINLT